MVRGEGAEVIDSRGHRLLDAAAGVGVLALGYSVPEIVEAMSAQAARLPYVHAIQFTTEVMAEFATELASICPTEISAFFVCCGGSEAMESALKIARQYQLERGQGTRSQFIGRWQSFHGNTLATQAVGGHLARRARHMPLLLPFPHIETPNCYRCGSTSDHADCGARFAEYLRIAIERAGPENVAGFVMETIGGSTMGAVVPPEGYLERVREICDEYGVLLILDEVFTAIGRTGKNLALEHWGVVPDLVVMGKGVAAGFAPIGVVGARDEVVRAFESGSGMLEHNFTFAGDPIVCAAGVTAIRLMAERGVTAHAEQAGRSLRNALDELLDTTVTVGDVRGKGLLLGIEFVQNRRSKTPFPREVGFARRVTAKAYENGLVVYPGTGTVDGGVGDHLTLCPPLVITEEQVRQIASRLGDAITAAEAELSLS
jgi:adenosylmethionine-8-amino-7-oxononanoate aminotransferase